MSAPAARPALTEAADGRTLEPDHVGAQPPPAWPVRVSRASGGSGLDQTTLVGEHHRLHAVSYGKFLQHVRDVRLHGVVAEEQLGVSAYCSGAVPLWPAIALALAFVPGFLPLPFDAGLVSFALLLIGLGAYGVLVMRMSNERWASIGQAWVATVPLDESPSRT